MNENKKHQLKQVICRPHRYTQWGSQFYVTFGRPVQQISMNLTDVPALV